MGCVEIIVTFCVCFALAQSLTRLHAATDTQWSPHGSHAITMLLPCYSKFMSTPSSACNDGTAEVNWARHHQTKL